MKVILNLWDGVRFDAIFKVNEWMGLPNLWKLIKNGVLYTNVFTHEPVMTPQAVGRIMHNRYGKPLCSSLWEKFNAKSCYVGYPEDNRRVFFKHCELLDVLYDRKAEEQYIRRHGSLHRKRITKNDHYRLDVACRKIPDFDFNFVYFCSPDETAHFCRDHNKHIYHYGSPYVHSIKNCDTFLGHLINTLEWCAKDDYVIIVVADHGMTDGGRHSVANWTTREVMQVPLVISGKGIRKNWFEQERYYTHDITSGIIGLFQGNTDNTIFQYAAEKYASSPVESRGEKVEK